MAVFRTVVIIAALLLGWVALRSEGSAHILRAPLTHSAP